MNTIYHRTGLVLVTNYTAILCSGCLTTSAIAASSTWSVIICIHLSTPNTTTLRAEYKEESDLLLEDEADSDIQLEETNDAEQVDI